MATKKKTYASILEATEKGSARDVLATMRAKLADKLDADKVASNSIAAAYKELRELDRLIRVIDVEVEQEAAQVAAVVRRREFRAAAI